MSPTHPDPLRLPGSARPRKAAPANDRIVTIHDVPWNGYEAICSALGDRSGVRIAYSKGTLELTNPGKAHEWVKETLGRLIEVYADETGIDISSFGSATFRKKAEERGAEPDKCYFADEAQEMPDLAIEVIFTSGSIDKLDVYAGLSVAELWFWKDTGILVYLLGPSGYERSTRSVLLPEIDVAELEELLRFGTQSEAVRAYRARLRQSRKRGD